MIMVYWSNHETKMSQNIAFRLNRENKMSRNPKMIEKTPKIKMLRKFHAVKIYCFKGEQAQRIKKNGTVRKEEHPTK